MGLLSCLLSWGLVTLVSLRRIGSEDFFFFLIFFFNVYLFLGQRETEHERGRGRERGRQRIRSRIRAVSTEPDAGLQLTSYKIMT